MLAAMASLPLPANDVLAMLHRLRAPERLAALPLAADLCRATGVPDAAEALARVAREALAGESDAQRRLRRAVFDVDFRAASVADVAAGMQLSRRQFQRLRARAVEAIGRRAAKLLQAGQASGSVAGACQRECDCELCALRDELDGVCGLRAGAAERYPSLPRALLRACERYAREAGGLPVEELSLAEAMEPFDEIARFECERLSFLRARARGHAFAMDRIAENLWRLAERPCDRAIAHACRAEARMRLGDRDGAMAAIAQLEGSIARRRDRRGTAALALLRAEMALFEGDRTLAQERALGAAALFGSGDRNAARARSVLARARREEPAEDEAAVRAMRERALETGCDELVARSAARLARFARARDDAEEAGFWYGESLEYLFRTRDVLLAARFFDEGAFADAPRDVLVRALHRRLRVVLPHPGDDTGGRRHAVRSLLVAIAACLESGELDRAGLAAACARVVSSRSAFARYAAKAAQSLEELFCLVGCAAFGRRFWSGRDFHARALVEIVTQALSQRARLAHCYDDDYGDAAEAARLRLRTVPIRSQAGPAVLSY